MCARCVAGFRGTVKSYVFENDGKISKRAPTQRVYPSRWVGIFFNGARFEPRLA
jgi:hypothetical protein